MLSGSAGNGEEKRVDPRQGRKGEGEQERRRGGTRSWSERPLHFAPESCERRKRRVLGCVRARFRPTHFSLQQQQVCCCSAGRICAERWRISTAERGCSREADRGAVETCPERDSALGMLRNRESREVQETEPWSPPLAPRACAPPWPCSQDSTCWAVTMPHSQVPRPVRTRGTTGPECSSLVSHLS